MGSKSLFDLDEKISGLLCYALGWISGIIYFVLEKSNKFVRFHALQSTVWFLLLFIVNIVLGWLVWIPVIGSIIGVLQWLIGLLSLASWIYLMVMANKGATFKIPIIGDAVENQINK
jgi:uncharacterized membrane protein